MAVTRSPVPQALASTLSSTPYEVMAASQQAHIDELVQKNRTYDHTVKKLQKALEEEKERAADAVKQLRAASADERAEWREGCDSLLASHRIVHLRTIMELDKERTQILKEGQETSKERLAVLERDFKLIVFQAKELESANRVAELEDLMEEMEEEQAETLAQSIQDMDDTIASLNARLAKSDASRRQAIEDLAAMEKEKEALQSDLSGLRSTHASLTASAASATTKLERSTLQLEGAKTSNLELERVNDELKRANADLKRQLDKWQTLETRGGTEMEEMRKSKIELEVQLKELQRRVKELEKGEKIQATALEKEKRRVEKLNEHVKKYSELAEEAQELAANSQNETMGKVRELAAVQMSLDELRALLEVERKTYHAKPISNKRLVELTPKKSDVSEIEVEDTLTPKAQPRGSKSKGIPKSRKAVSSRSAPVSDDESNEEEAGDTQESEPDERVPRNNKTRKGKNGAEDVSEQNENIAGRKARAKEKENHVKDRVEKKRLLSEAPSAKASQKTAELRKLSSNQKGSTQEAESQEPRKKKIRIFPPSQPMSFTWNNAISQGESGVVIPTELSPVKETDIVPRRSVFGRVGSALGL